MSVAHSRTSTCHLAPQGHTAFRRQSYQASQHLTPLTAKLITKRDAGAVLAESTLFISLRIAYWYKLTQLLQPNRHKRPAGAFMTGLASGQALIEALQDGPSHKDTAATRKGSLPLTELRAEKNLPSPERENFLGEKEIAKSDTQKCQASYPMLPLYWLHEGIAT